VRWEGYPASAVGNGAWWRSAANRLPDSVSVFFPFRSDGRGEEDGEARGDS
jgi:hypothetical protein